MDKTFQKGALERTKTSKIGLKKCQTPSPSLKCEPLGEVVWEYVPFRL